MKRLFFLLTLLLLLTALCLLLTSCVSVGYVYTDAKKYTAGGTRIDGRVEDIDINWIDGAVNVARHDGNGIILKETSGKKLSQDEELHWYLDGKELKVQYAASGFRRMSGLQKELTVFIVSQRASSIRNADRIIVLDDGDVVEFVQGIVENGDQPSVDLQRDDLAVAERQLIGQRSHTGTDFKDGAVLILTASIGNILNHRAVGQKVLPKLLAKGQVEHTHHLFYSFNIT